ncbi:hypothetical protein C8R43DRAFT_1237566 [Mycena crocata]|nr:hypothetical protein C8R43DRAFT_1237566 [Mycena crocata]
MEPTYPQKFHQQILRSRSRSFGSTPPKEPDISLFKKSKNPSGPRLPSRRRFAVLRRVSDIYKIFLLSIILLAVIFPVRIWPTTPVLFPAVATTPPSRERQTTIPNPSQTKILSLPAEVPSNLRKVPLVDRSILQRLADMEISPDPDERPYFASSRNWPPLVTRIPEPKKRIGPSLPPLDICGAAPCRFLLPLRIGEQESKARMHFMEILQLAQKLNRILVLPNVGKSRMGACFKSEFEMYYETEDLAATIGLVATVKLDLFRRWVDAEAPSAQLSFFSSKKDPLFGVDPTLFSNDDVSIRVGATGSSVDVPGCFTKFHALRLDTHTPLYIHLKPHGQPHPIDDAIVDALTRPEILAATARVSPPLDPAVLVVTWDLRHPIFPPPPVPLRLQYAPHLHALAAALAPSTPYIMVHWRMESVTPTTLPQCAHALVETLAHLPGGIRTIWFASDYPHAVHRSALPGEDFGAQTDSHGSPPMKAKSGTFRDAGPLHAVAVGIFGDAFAPGGDLEGWEVAELTEPRVAEMVDWEPEVLEDPGVRAIVDKLIGMRAALFVSGAPGCGRVSSFTRQIIDEREKALRINDELENVVEFFG